MFVMNNEWDRNHWVHFNQTHLRLVRVSDCPKSLNNHDATIELRIYCNYNVTHSLSRLQRSTQEAPGCVRVAVVPVTVFFFVVIAPTRDWRASPRAVSEHDWSQREVPSIQK